MTQPDAIKRVAVLGAGTIGASWTALFLSRGRTMATPELTDAVCQQIIDDVAAEAHGRSIAELARERDAILLPLLERLAERDG